MPLSRRDALLPIASLASAWLMDGSTKPGRAKIRKIATEEAFTIPEMIEPVRKVLKDGGPGLDLVLLNTIYNSPGNAAPTSTQGGSRDAERIFRIAS